MEGLGSQCSGPAWSTCCMPGTDSRCPLRASWAAPIGAIVSANLFAPASRKTSGSNPKSICLPGSVTWAGGLPLGPRFLPLWSGDVWVWRGPSRNKPLLPSASPTPFSARAEGAPVSPVVPAEGHSCWPPKEEAKEGTGRGAQSSELRAALIPSLW